MLNEGKKKEERSDIPQLWSRPRSSSTASPGRDQQTQAEIGKPKPVSNHHAVNHHVSNRQTQAHLVLQQKTQIEERAQKEESGEWRAQRGKEKEERKNRSK